MNASTQRAYPSNPKTQADIFYEAGTEKHRLGALAAASDLYVQALRADADYAPALHMLSTMEFQKGNSDAALQGLMHVVDMGYHTAMVWWHLGCVQLALRHAPDAVISFQHALELKPDDAELRFNLGCAARQAGQLELAILALRQSAKQINAPAAYCELGLACHLHGKFDDAMQAYQAALALEPHDVSVLLNIGALALEREDCETAITYFRRVLVIAPHHVKAQMNLGLAVQTQGDPKAAAECFSALLQHPLTLEEHIETLTNLTAAQLRIGEFVQAETHARAVLAIDPLHDASIANLTASCDAQNQTGAGIAHLQSVTQNTPEQLKAWFLLGAALEREKQNPAAMDAYRQAINRDDSYAAAHDALGRLCSMQGDNPTAFQHCKKAVMLAPWENGYQLNLGLVAMRCDDAKTALNAFDEVLSGNPFDQQALAYRAMALHMLGRHDEANAYTNPDDVVKVFDLPPPDGVTNMTAFLDTLAQDLRDVRGRIWAPYGQSVRGGTQTQNVLFSEKACSIQLLRAYITKAIEAYIATWPDAPQHPFYGCKPKRLFFRSWSVILKEGGYHTPHIHPEGCLSGVFYVAVPHLNGDEGSLELGKPGISIAALEKPNVLPPTRRVRPAPARLVLFPSYLWHGVLPFTATGDAERITVAFDVIQAP